MPRQARIVLPGYLHHVTQRGNYRQAIFDEQRDRVYYLKLIQEYSQKYGNDIFAFCLMDNHVHFIIRPHKKDSLSGIFCRAHQRYAYYYHQKKDLTGHLWQERFYSCLLQDTHMINAMRYVERNPVRVGKVAYPWEYAWSSARSHLGIEYKIIKLADTKEFFDVSSWQEFISEEESKKDLRTLRESTQKGLVVGSKEFIAGLEKVLNRVLVPRPRGRPLENHK